MQLFQQAVSDARSDLGDTYAGNYSYSPADMIRYAADGVREAWRVRPSTRYDDSLSTLHDPATTLPASTNDDYYPIPLPEEYQTAIMYYIMFRCLSRDVTDAGNAKAAAAAYEQFKQIMAG